MLKFVDYNEIPDSDLVPTDAYHLTVMSAEKEYSDDGRVSFHATCRVDGPAAYAGATIHPRFYIGTDEDPDGDADDTWKKRGGQNFKKFIAAVWGLEQTTGDPENDFVGCLNYPVGCLIELRTDIRQTKRDAAGNTVENEYFGQPQQRFNKWFNLSDPEAPAAGSMASVSAGRPGPAARPAAARPAAAARPGPAQRPAARAPSQPPASAAAPEPAAEPARTVAARPGPRPGPAGARPGPTAGARPAPGARPGPAPGPRPGPRPVA